MKFVNWLTTMICGTFIGYVFGLIFIADAWARDREWALNWLTKASKAFKKD